MSVMRKIVKSITLPEPLEPLHMSRHTSLEHVKLEKVKKETVWNTVIFGSLLLSQREGVFNKINPEHRH